MDLCIFGGSPSQPGRFELPKWADVVKTSKAKELPPSATWAEMVVGLMACLGHPSMLG